MLRSNDGEPYDGQPAIPPSVELRHEWDWPDNPLLCMLVTVDNVVYYDVNAAHGRLGYLHAAYHAERGLEGPWSCHLGTECGYDAGAYRGPDCVPSRRAALESRAAARDGT